MKILSLVRHAKSSWDDPALEDRDRPLSPRGLRDAPHMAVHLARLSNPPDALVSSPALRAMATAEIFARQLGRAPESILPEPSLYEAHWTVLLDAVRGFPEEWNHVLLFGHNPGFEELAGNLTGELLAGLPTCSVLELQLCCKSWKEAKTRRAVLSRLFFPKMFAWGCP
ncbi:MAG TPA: histidine phosphatase family protein [Verrucomicrobiales bacterium]|nr:histidine phosphatase family protein [Verrucomicrobiales bacterium]